MNATTKLTPALYAAYMRLLWIAHIALDAIDPNLITSPDIMLMSGNTIRMAFPEKLAEATFRVRSLLGILECEGLHSGVVEKPDHARGSAYCDALRIMAKAGLIRERRTLDHRDPVIPWETFKSEEGD